MLLNDPGGNGIQLSGPLGQLGFSDLAVEALGLYSESQFDLYDWSAGSRSQATASEYRMDQWASLNESADPGSAGRFLTTVLGSPLERESAAAAAVLVRFLPDEPQYLGDIWPDPRAYWDIWPGMSQLLEEYPWLLAPPFFTGALEPDAVDDSPSAEWNGERWSAAYEEIPARLRGRRGRTYFLWLLVVARLRLALRSPDPVTRSFAFAAHLGQTPDDIELTPEVASTSTPPGSLVVSTMVHGTFGWKGDWWRPIGGFHKHILNCHRANLYNRGARFSWSGAYSANQRRIAAIDLNDWATEVAPNGLQTVFAHSYGGEVAALAALSGNHPRARAAQLSRHRICQSSGCPWHASHRRPVTVRPGLSNRGDTPVAMASEECRPDRTQLESRPQRHTQRMGLDRPRCCRSSRLVTIRARSDRELPG